VDRAAPTAVDLAGRLHEAEVRALVGHALGSSTAARLDEVMARYAAPSWRLVGFDATGSLVGCVGYAAETDESATNAASVQHIAVVPEARRSSVGRTMLRWLREVEGLRSLRAETDEDAVGFYRRCGFRTERVTHPRFPAARRWACTLRAADTLR
jgi:ribosomal protein S18 acetylase RimI-like enzyme